MRDSGCKHLIYIIVCSVTLCLLGCMPTHTDTLVFGTNTKYAFDLSLNATTNVPSLTVGYTRQEGVWMPLYVNGKDSRYPSSTNAAFGNFTGESVLKYTGNSGGDRDTYSVLASFGTTIEAGRDSSAGIAQYFATGLAARKLADNARVAETLSIQPVERQTLDAQKKAIENLEKFMSSGERVEAEEAGKKLATLQNAKIELIVDHFAADGNVTGLDVLLGKPEIKSFEQLKSRLLKAKTADALRNTLRYNDQSAVDPLFKAIFQEKAPN